MKGLARRLINYAAVKRNTLVKPYLKGNVLDLGCGAAHLTDFVPMRNYIGIDANENTIQRLKEIKPDYEFHQIDLDNKASVLKLKGFKTDFETITLIAVLEHLHHPQIILESCSQLLKDNGVLVITTPSRLGDKVGRVAFQMAGNKNPPFPHVRIYARQDLEMLLAPLGFKLREYRKFLLGANQLFICSKSSQSSN